MMRDETAIYILRRIAQARLAHNADLLLDHRPSELRAALTSAFGALPQIAPSEGGLARSALDLLSEDPAYAETIAIMAGQSETAGPRERYLDFNGIALTAAALLVLQTRIRIKVDNTGKWLIEIDKKSVGESAVRLLVQRLLSSLDK